jgi:hypothetical protein
MDRNIRPSECLPEVGAVILGRARSRRSHRRMQVTPPHHPQRTRGRLRSMRPSETDNCGHRAVGSVYSSRPPSSAGTIAGGGGSTVSRTSCAASSQRLAGRTRRRQRRSHGRWTIWPPSPPTPFRSLTSSTVCPPRHAGASGSIGSGRLRRGPSSSPIACSQSSRSWRPWPRSVRSS